MSKKKYEIIEIPKTTCTICGETKECIKFKYEDTFLMIFPDQEEIKICETCLSKAFRKLKKNI